MECLAIFFKFSQNSEAKMNIFLESAMTESQIKGKEQLNKLNKGTKVFSANFDDYEKQRNVKDEIIR